VPLKVYYVDDEPELCELFVELFSDNEINIQSFSDPIAAVGIISSDPPDLIFMDFRMPGINGVEMAKKLDPKLKKYLISGENSVASDYPFEQVLSKPLNIQLVRDILEANKGSGRA